MEITDTIREIIEKKQKHERDRHHKLIILPAVGTVDIDEVGQNHHVNSDLREDRTYAVL